MIKTRCGYVSITGNFRDNNEDRCLIDDDGRYFLVADGMGGQSAGEKASELATEIVSEKLNQLIEFDGPASDSVIKGIDEAVAYANTEIMALGKLEPAFHNMGTTLVFIVTVEKTLFIGGIGDSRVYQLRDGKLQQLTEDHSLTEALKKAGTISEEEAKNHRYKNVLYRYLGTKEGGTGTKAVQIEPTAADRYLLCSDGVTDGTEDEQILKLLTTIDDPQTACEEIVAAAQAGGSKDNITCVIVDIIDVE